MLTKTISYFGIHVNLSCDGKCEKAWGINARPTNGPSEDPDDYEYLADDELPVAPVDPGTYEGLEMAGKPLSTSEFPNKWCARQCERSIKTELGKPIILPDCSKRISNMERILPK